MNRTTAIIGSVGAAATGYLALIALRRMTADKRTRAPALASGDRHVAETFSATRSAGPDAMRDPPAKWDEVDQSLDETFPASDPMPVGSRVD